MKLWGSKSQNASRGKVSTSSSFEHPRLGVVTLNHSLKAKRISIRVDASAGVKLTLPHGIATREGLRFLEQKVEWVEAARERALARSSATRIIEPPFSTKFHSLRLVPQPRENVSVSITESEIVVYYPNSIHHSDPNVQAIIAEAVERVCRIEAHNYLGPRTEQLAAYCRRVVPQYRCNLGKVSVRKARTRWGSCAANNNISLNIGLMLLPDRLIDYVILHELTHTVHKNHSAQFHGLLNKLLGGHEAQLVKEIRTYRPIK